MAIVLSETSVAVLALMYLSRVATGCGQSLALVFDESPVSTTLSNDMQSQLRVESLCAQISKTAFVMSETMTDESYDRHLLVIDDLARNLDRIELEFADQSDQSKRF